MESKEPQDEPKKRASGFITHEDHEKTVRTRFKVHGLCWVIGTVAAVILTYIPATHGLTMHIMPAIPAAPSGIMEAIDLAMRT